MRTERTLKTLRAYTRACAGERTKRMLGPFGPQRAAIEALLASFEGSKLIRIVPAEGRGETDMQNEDTVTIRYYTAIRRAEKAILVKFDDASEHWIPRRRSSADRRSRNVPDQGDLVLSQWFADNANLFDTGKAAASGFPLSR